MSDSLLEIKDLCVEYRTGNQVVHAVNGVSLTLRRGKTLGIVGETGAGKTTTALSVLQLLPERTAHITSGEILFDGIDIVQAKKNQMRKIRGERISMIFQDPMTALNPVLKVGDQIAEAMELHNSGKKSRIEIEKKVCDILEMVGIPASRRNCYPHEFSGGMKQRVVIAIALACEPDLLLADEPTTALDVTIQAQVLAMMNELKARLNTSVVMITHDFGIVAQTCDDVAVMYAGEIVEYGSLEDLFTPGAAHHPYTASLFAAIPMIHGNEKRLHPIDGLMPDPTRLPSGCKFSERCLQCGERCRTAHPREIWDGTHMIACHMAEKERP